MQNEAHTSCVSNFAMITLKTGLFVRVNVTQSIYKPLLSETDEVNRCERFPLTPCARTSQNKETIHYNTTNFRAEVGGPDSGSAWYF